MSSDFADVLPPGAFPYRNGLETRIEALEQGQVVYAAKTDVRIKHVEQEVVDGRNTLERKVDQILGALTTLTDSQNEHFANHKAEQRYRDEAAAKAAEQDRVHSARIRELEADKASKERLIVAQGKEIAAHGSLLNRLGTTPHGRAALASGTGLSLLAVIELAMKSLAHQSVIDAIFKHLFP